MKTGNEYVRALGKLFADTPKTVFAAIAYSHASAGGADHIGGIKGIIQEWRVLYENGIVSQKPPTDFTVAIKLSEKEATCR